jgi:His-Xaa-Ser system protein HxsD
MPAKKKDGAAAESTVETTVGEGTATLVVHKSLYPTDVLFGTAFGFLDRCFVFLDMVDKDRVRVELTARPGVDPAAVVGEFKNELVNQAVRLRLAKQTEEVRTMVVGRAIGQSIPVAEEAPQPAPVPFPADLPPEVAKILAEEEESLDFLDDPLGIAVPWEEKYAKKEGQAAPAEGAKDAKGPTTGDA